MTNKLVKFASLLIILMPVFLITGPFLSDLSVILIDLIFLYLIFKNQNTDILLKNNLFIFLIIFNFYISIRSIFTDEIFFSLKSSLPYVRFLVFIFAVSYFLKINKKLEKNFSKSFLLLVLVVCIDAIFQYIFGFNFLGFRIDNPDKLNGFFGDEAVLGSYLIRLFPLILVSFFCLYGFKDNKYKFYILFTLVSFVIFLSGSRSSLALLILFVTLTMLLFSELRKTFLIVFSLSILLFILLLQFSEKLKYKTYINFYNPIQTIFFAKDLYADEQKKFYFFTPIHDSHYRTAYNIFKDNKIFGAGNKMYRKVCGKEGIYINKYSCTTHPHNFYLQVLAENGIIGLVFIASIFIMIFLKLFKEILLRNFKNEKIYDNKSILLLIGIFLNLWPIIPSGNFFNNWLSVLMYFPVGFLIYFTSKRAK